MAPGARLRDRAGGHGTRNAGEPQRPAAPRRRARLPEPALDPLLQRVPEPELPRRQRVRAGLRGARSAARPPPRAPREEASVGGDGAPRLLPARGPPLGAAYEPLRHRGRAHHRPGGDALARWVVAGVSGTVASDRAGAGGTALGARLLAGPLRALRRAVPGGRPAAFADARRSPAEPRRGGVHRDPPGPLRPPVQYRRARRLAHPSLLARAAGLRRRSQCRLRRRLHAAPILSGPLGPERLAEGPGPVRRHGGGGRPRHPVRGAPARLARVGARLRGPDERGLLPA